MKKFFPKLLCFLLLVAAVLLPPRSADIHLILSFDKIESGECTLYYETADCPGYSQERCITTPITEDQTVDFFIDAALVRQITGLRIDMQNTEQLICLKNISVRSAGMIQKNFNPCFFMASENIAARNAISEISLVTTQKRAFLRCSADDPYWILSSELVQDIQAGQSHYLKTRFGLLLFLFFCWLFRQKKVFSETDFATESEK